MLRGRMKMKQTTAKKIKELDIDRRWDKEKWVRSY